MWEKAEQGLQKMGGHLGKGWEDAVLGSRDTPWYRGGGQGLPVPTCWWGGMCDSRAAGMGHS